ncbi:FtsX-like permease family protein [Cryptosporangium aurantiacum]|uniref:FtsX-like permease family protein n=1 Tax=Cryptosporangium aurantiacum TaxID=134849 RepID=A0A1M7MTE9_9ACTN|nr:FtsX-like permease family protein [Cryptosporangium aurantiacum]SHM94292.1 FtsX-like permease family protein [Cryptosporangium aurantiacum]
MRLSVLLRLAVTGGRLDGLRIVLTAFGAVLATLLLLAAATVVSIVGQAAYTNGLLAEPGLRPGVTTALLLLGIPVLFFVGQCVRVGAPARDRRLAEYRMAGATPGQVSAVAATETGVAALIGTAIGFALFLVGRVVLDEPGPQRPLPTDVLPPWWALLAIFVAVPAAGAALAAVALRRSTLTAFGVVRRRPGRPPRALPAVLFFGGSTVLALSAAIIGQLSALSTEWWLILFDLVLLVAVLIGLVTGGAAVSAAIGRWIAPRAKSPALLLAARRLIADPWAASRTLPAVLAAVLLGAGALTMRAVFAADRVAQQEARRMIGQEAGPIDPFYDRAFALTQLAVWVAIVVAAGGLLVATAEQVLERRRTLAALTAQGTPTGVLAKALLWQNALPLVPGLVLAAATGAIAVRAVYGGPGEYMEQVGGDCTPPAGTDVNTWCADPAHLTPVRTVTVELEGLIPWGGLTVLTVGAAVATMVVCALSLLLLRRATSVGELRTT